MGKPVLKIKYCPKCRWILRASWIAQELLFTFPEDFESVALMPSEAGVFEVLYNESLLFSRKEAGRFPEAKELKQKVRDLMDPSRSLGHSDR